ncbi:MAG TPA: hypothetical protein VJ910_03835 [Desulfuromonadales bacterium]|nr:hypothetical protein [Desulfuromonadales bacterium]
MRKAFLLLTIVAVSTFSAVPCPAQEPLAELKHRPFQESFQDEAPVSGRVVAGVLLTGSAADQALSLAPPRTAAGSSICIQVLSRDGRYWAENTFELPGTMGTGPVRLEYPSQHRSFLQQLGFGELAILGTAGECGASTGTNLYLAGTMPEPGKASASVFVNSGRADTYIAIKNLPDSRRPTRCRTIEEGRRTGFDTICPINLEVNGPLPENLEVRILRRRYERMLPPTEFTLLLPGRT